MVRLTIYVSKERVSRLDAPFRRRQSQLAAGVGLTIGRLEILLSQWLFVDLNPGVFKTFLKNKRQRENGKKERKGKERKKVKGRERKGK